MKTVLMSQVEAIVPIYNEVGANVTRVKQADGDTEINKSVKAVLKGICEFYHYDLKSSNKTYGEMLSIKKMPPIPFTRELIFIAVKTRVSIGKDDGAFSYVNIEEIESVGNGIIYFKEGNSLEFLSRDKTVIKYIKYAKILRNENLIKPLVVREAERDFEIFKIDRMSLEKDFDAINKIKQEMADKYLK